MNEMPLPPRFDEEPLPLVGVSACRKLWDGALGHWTSERYLQAVADGARAVPVQIPALGTHVDESGLHALLARLDGLFLTGSPSNIEPHHYDGEPSAEGTLHDPDRDATSL